MELERPLSSISLQGPFLQHQVLFSSMVRRLLLKNLERYAIKASQEPTNSSGPSQVLPSMKTFLWGSILESTEKADSLSMEKEAYELLQLTGLLQKANTPAKNLTLVGRKQLEIARALATHPKVLLLDEAVSGLNPTETETMMDLIRKIQSRGITVFMIEHIMKAVMGLSNRILVLNFGELIAQGTPEEVSMNKDVIEAYLGADGVQVA